MTNFSLKKLFVQGLMMTFKVPRDLVHFAYKRYGKRIAIYDDKGSMTYDELKDRSLKLAAAWTAMGIEKGDKIFTILPEGREQIETRLAAYEMGGTLVTFHQHLNEENAIEALLDVQPALCIYSDKWKNVLEQVNKDIQSMHIVLQGKAYEDLIDNQEAVFSKTKILPSETASLHFTSGTTGQPKLIVVSQAKYLKTMKMVLRQAKINVNKTGKPDVNIVGVPLTGPGSGLVLPSILAGSALVIPLSYKAEMLLSLIEKHGVTRGFIPPSPLIDILDHPRLEEFDLSSLQNIIYGSALMPAAKTKEALEFFGPILQQAYGSFEVMPPITALSTADHMQHGKPASKHRLNSSGKVVSEVKVKIIGEKGEELPTNSPGKVWVKSPMVFKGYYNKPELLDSTTKDGWTCTGDFAYFDEEGYLHLLGRDSDIIEHNGIKIFPREVEQIAHEHPKVKEAALVKVNDKVTVTVSLRHAYTEEANYYAYGQEILEYIKNNIEVSKIPDKIKVFDDLPKSFLGKILRREIRTLLTKNMNQLIY